MPNNNNNTNFAYVTGQSVFFSARDRFTEAEDFEVLRQDAANSDDEVDGGLFKKLYPETERDEATGETYCVISEVGGHNNGKPVKVDVVAINVGKEKNGKKKGAYLLKSQVGDALKQVYVDAHGGYNPWGKNIIKLKPGVPVIAFLGAHKKVLTAGLNDMNSYAEVSFEGITITSEQARDDFNNFGYKAITGTSILGAVCDYSLAKFVEEPTDGAVHYFEDLAVFMHEKKELGIGLSKLNSLGAVKTFLSFSGFEDKTLPISDRIQIRDSGPNFSARDTLKIAQEHGYKKIIFSFCRSSSSPFSFKEEIYDAEDTKLLEQSLFYSWDDIKKLEMEKGRASESQEAPSCSAPRMSR